MPWLIDEQENHWIVSYLPRQRETRSQTGGKKDSELCASIKPIIKRACAPPVSFRTMPENKIPPAMQVVFVIRKFLTLFNFAAAYGSDIKYTATALAEGVLYHLLVSVKQVCGDIALNSTCKTAAVNTASAFTIQEPFG